MLQLFKDILLTTLAIAIPFTILYGLFWYYLDKYLTKRAQKQYALINNKSDNTLRISYSTNYGNNFGSTYYPSEKMYGPTGSPETHNHYERQNNSQLPEQKTYHERRRRRSKSLFPWWIHVSTRTMVNWLKTQAIKNRSVCHWTKHRSMIYL